MIEKVIKIIRRTERWSVEDQAREIIRGLREPTATMVDHGFRKVHNLHRGQKDVRRLYRFMIDVAS